MPIEVKRDIVRIAAPDFHRMDFDITGLAFAIHNEFGRLLHEKIYRNELVNRCRKAGFKNVETEVPITSSLIKISAKHILLICSCRIQSFMS